ncbi:MAG: SPOR domain-containing protein [Erythrobacter sp.]|nr:SPOR domain-containing protein [Erythrobacter sp.]NCQ62857.1 SPOR domain-containing protein [Alphaproteobacteria bacterium]
MIRQNNSKGFARSLMVATALASLTLAGCAGSGDGSRTASASEATEARAAGNSIKAVTLAEQAVRAAPQDISARAELGASYLAAGRFRSAQQAFEDALVLGDPSPDTALGFVLASIAVGDNRAALGTLDEWRDAISASDLGLAYALAGNPELGAQVLSNALRAGENTPVMRQNLAYAHALGGEWATARIIAAEDVAPGELDQRISQWASVARPEDYAARVAALLGVSPQVDEGMPAQLALGATAEMPEAFGAADTQVAAAPRSGELPPVDLLAASATTRELKPLDEPIGARPAAPAPASSFASAFTGGERTVASRVVKDPVAQATPAARTPAVATPSPAAPAAVASASRTPASRPGTSASSDLASGSHLVQLGSYASEADAKRGWSIFAKRYPQISGRDQVITRAKVNGRIYYRLSAGNLAASSAKSLCQTVKAAGSGCIAWEESKPLPGTLDSGRRVATR